MFPPLIILGVMLGMVPRGWVGLAVVVIGWPVLVMVTGSGGSDTGFVELAAFTGGNAGVGFAAGLLLRPITSRIVDRMVP